MKVAVIGAGAAGLVTVKHVLEIGFDCKVFEQTDKVGGTWNYTEKVGTDENGLPIHTSMYDGVRTNLPKESMEYPDFPYSKAIKESYISQPLVLEYLNNYADAYGLRKSIKFCSYVVSVEPNGSSGWLLTILDAKTKETALHSFDAVIVCIGHYSTPNLPKIKGQERFKGCCIHSHDYRTKSPYKDKKVLILGGGSSGTDITIFVASVAETVYFSYRTTKRKAVYPSNVILKPALFKYTENGGYFEDGSYEKFDQVIYCTGYLYSYPFLSEKCGINVKDNFINYLYKHIVNISHPNMAFIGVPFQCNLFAMFDLQIKFFLATLNGKFKLPSKDQMLEEIKIEVEEKSKRGWPKRHWHMLREYHKQYLDDLADCAACARASLYIHKLLHFAEENHNKNYVFEVLDNETFGAEIVNIKQSTE